MQRPVRVDVHLSVALYRGVFLVRRLELGMIELLLTEASTVAGM
jgi:hypothetical protein